MAVEVEEAARVHEAVVLGVIRLGAARRERSGATASTSSRDDTLKQYSASVCVVGSAIGSFANSANFSRLSSMTKACSPTSMQAAVSSVNIGL